MLEKVLMYVPLLIIVGLTIVFVWTIWKDASQAVSEQMVVANVEKLKAAIEEACYKGYDYDAIKIKFELPQGIPLSTGLVGSFAEMYVGNFLIKQLRYGDPAYVLYYETFPPGEGVSWEFYNDFDYRVIAMLPEDRLNDPDRYIEEVKRRVRQRILSEDPEAGDKRIDVILGNVILTEGFDPTTGTSVEKVSAIGEFFGIGEWDPYYPTSGTGKTNFIFDNYFAMSAMNKSFLKYQPCGEDRLCLKTTKGIFTYPLEYCDIDYIGFTGGGEILQPWYEWSRFSNFYFVSPCELEVEVYMGECEDFCERVAKYPIYGYSKETELYPLNAEHVLCLQDRHMEGDKDMLPEPDELDDELKCVMISFGGKGDHCFSYDQYSLTPGVGIKLVKEHVEYLHPDIYIMKPVDTDDISMIRNAIGEAFGDDNVVWP